jgi:hypothetical protein
MSHGRVSSEGGVTSKKAPLTLQWDLVSVNEESRQSFTALNVAMTMDIPGPWGRKLTATFADFQ